MSYLAVIGHTNIDVQLSVATMPKADASAPVLGRRTVYGGTACNIARHAAGLGVPVRLWSRVGADFPPEWYAGLQDDGVDLSLLERAAPLTPTCYIFTDAAGKQAYSMDQAAMTPPYTVPPAVLEGLVTGAGGKAGWLHVSTGDPASYLPVVKQAKAAGIHIAFDPGQEIHFAYDAKQFEAMLELADVFFCNDSELAKAFEFQRYGDPLQMLDHVDTMVVTHGAGGATLYHVDDKPVELAAFPTDVVDPTGAGDALRAGWYYGLRLGTTAVDALRLGMAAAAVIVRHQGPQSYVVKPVDLSQFAQLPPTQV